MALIIIGKSKCGICKCVIKKANNIIGFPAFLSPEHKLYKYSDGVYHKRCFDECADRDEIRVEFEQYKERIGTYSKMYNNNLQLKENVESYFSRIIKWLCVGCYRKITKETSK